MTKDDRCRVIIDTSISIPLEKAGLNDSYYNGAYLTISDQAGNPITIQLPFQ